MNKEVLFSSEKMDWETPQALFDVLNKEFSFTLDAACSEENKKCNWGFTEKDDSLRWAWQGRVWLNPPYGRGLKTWIEKAFLESKECWNEFVVVLIPARTDTKFFHEIILPNAKEIRFIKGRLKFGNAKDPAPFPSMIVIFDKTKTEPVKISSYIL